MGLEVLLLFLFVLVFAFVYILSMLTLRKVSRKILICIITHSEKKVNTIY